MNKFYLRLYPDPVLRQPAVKVEHGEDLTELLTTMKEVRRFYNGAGLAAQQVGSTHAVALMMLRCRDGKGKIISAGGNFLTEEVVCINPSIISRSAETRTSIQEGCLSAQNEHTGRIFRTSKRRAVSVTLQYQDEVQFATGQVRWHIRNLTEFDAIIAQHELDHLEGKCIVDDLPRQQRKQLHRLMELV